MAKFAVKDAFGTGIAAVLSAASAAGTTLLMLHFLRRLAMTDAAGDRPAPAGLLLPWLAMAAATLLMPWLLYAPAGLGSATAAVDPQALWQALWPVLAGVAHALALGRRADRLPSIPEGDIAAGLEPALRVSRGLGARLDGLDCILRGWTVASVALVLVAMAIGWTLLPY